MNPRRCQTEDDASVKDFAETRPDNLRFRTYVWGSDLSGSMQGADGVGGLLAVSYYGSATTNCFPAFDGNGNVMAYINAADGTSVAQLDYDPFLGITRSTGPMANLMPLLGSTKYYDWENGLYYYGYRYDRPNFGWLNRDPIQEQGGLNLYGFVGNNSINYVDADGRIIPIIIVTISVGKGVSHLILACVNCSYCSKCTDRARATMDQAAAGFGNDAEGFANWLKAAQPGAECAPLCADCLHEALWVCR